MTEALLFVADAGAAPEPELARDIVRRGLPVAPVVIAIAGAIAGINGALSAAVAVGLVLTNFALAAVSLAWAARVNLALLMAVALFGYLVRLGLLFVVVLVLQDMSWMHLVSFGITLIVTHLGLLAWELRYVSATLAHPALKPTASKPSSPKERNR
jgi:hypothetical protein